MARGSLTACGRRRKRFSRCAWASRRSCLRWRAWPGPLFVRLFTQDDEVAALSVWAIRVCTLAAIPLGAQYEIVDGFTALGQVKISFPLSFFRKGVYFAALFILPACFGARAAFYAEPVSDIVGPLVSAIVYKLCIGHVLSDEHARI